MTQKTLTRICFFPLTILICLLSFSLRSEAQLFANQNDNFSPNPNTRPSAPASPLLTIIEAIRPFLAGIRAISSSFRGASNTGSGSSSGRGVSPNPNDLTQPGQGSSVLLSGLLTSLLSRPSSGLGSGSTSSGGGLGLLGPLLSSFSSGYRANGQNAFRGQSNGQPSANFGINPNINNQQQSRPGGQVSSLFGSGLQSSPFLQPASPYSATSSPYISPQLTAPNVGFRGNNLRSGGELPITTTPGPRLILQLPNNGGTISRPIDLQRINLIISGILQAVRNSGGLTGGNSPNGSNNNNVQFLTNAIVNAIFNRSDQNSPYRSSV